jgi:hypothetical protein
MKLQWISLVSTTSFVSTICLITPECVRAQSAPGAAQPLSPIVVTGTKPGVERGRDEHATRVIRRPPVERVYPTTPLASSSIDADKVPAAVTTVDAAAIARTGSLNNTDALVQSVPSIMINEVAGNSMNSNVRIR